MMTRWSSKSPEPTVVGAVSSAAGVRVACRRYTQHFSLTSTNMEREEKEA